MNQWINTIDVSWMKANLPWIMIGAFVVIQWIVLQSFLINYILFRQKLKTPTPDKIRFNLIEQNLNFSQEQIERLFSKLAEFRKEISEVQRAEDHRAEAPQDRGSVESSFKTLGELHMQRRIAELQRHRDS